MRWGIVPITYDPELAAARSGAVPAVEGYAVLVQTESPSLQDVVELCQQHGDVVMWSEAEGCANATCALFPAGWLAMLLPPRGAGWVAHLPRAATADLNEARSFLRSLRAFAPVQGADGRGIAGIVRALAARGSFLGLVGGIPAPREASLRWDDSPGGLGAVSYLRKLVAHLRRSVQRMGTVPSWTGDTSHVSQHLASCVEAIRRWTASCSACTFNLVRSRLQWTRWTRDLACFTLPETQGADAVCAFPEMAQRCRGRFPVLYKYVEGTHAAYLRLDATTDALMHHVVSLDPGFVDWAKWLLVLAGVREARWHLHNRRVLDVPVKAIGPDHTGKAYVPLAVVTVAYEDPRVIFTVGRTGQQWACGMLACDHFARAHEALRALALANPEGIIGTLLRASDSEDMVELTSSKLYGMAGRVRAWLYYAYILADVLGGCGLFGQVQRALDEAGLHENGAYVWTLSGFMHTLAGMLQRDVAQGSSGFPIYTLHPLNRKQKRDQGLYDGLLSTAPSAPREPPTWLWLVQMFWPHSPKLQRLVDSLQKQYLSDLPDGKGGMNDCG